MLQKTSVLKTVKEKGSGFLLGVFFEHLVFFPSSSSPLLSFYGYEIPLLVESLVLKNRFSFQWGRVFSGKLFPLIWTYLQRERLPSILVFSFLVGKTRMCLICTICVCSSFLFFFQASYQGTIPGSGGLSGEVMPVGSSGRKSGYRWRAGTRGVQLLPRWQMEGNVAGPATFWEFQTAGAFERSGRTRVRVDLWVGSRHELTGSRHDLLD